MAKIMITLFGILFTTLSVSSQVPVYDDFERANLGFNWSIYAGSPVLVDNSDLGYQSTGYFSIVGWTANTFSADQYSEAQYSPNRIDSLLGQVFVRRRAGDGARYGFHWDDRNGGRYEIKYDGVPTPQVRILASLVAPEPLGGDTMRIEIEEMTIRGYHNGDLLLTVTDTAFITSTPITSTGPPGMAFRFTIDFPPIYPVSIFEWWGGGNYISTLGVYESSVDDNLSIYPNPSSDFLNVQFKNDNYWGSTITITNISGQKIFTLTTDSPSEIVDVKTFSKGVYFINVIGPKISTTKKITIF